MSAPYWAAWEEDPPAMFCLLNAHGLPSHQRTIVVAMARRLSEDGRHDSAFRSQLQQLLAVCSDTAGTPPHLAASLPEAVFP